VTRPRRTSALDRAQRQLDRVRAGVAAHEPGYDPWRLVEAQARYDAALAAALDGPAEPDDAGRDLPPRAYVGRGGR
jgi:hypothetical protein